MNIIVCVSSVPDTTSKINFKNNDTEFQNEGVQFVINPYDEFGLTKAIMLKERYQAKVTVVTVGDNSVEPIMRKALAIGADEAVRINMNPLDSYSVALSLVDYLKSNDYDLIICGRESIDYNGNAVPAIIAESLDIPFVNACIGLEIDDRTAKMLKEIDGGKEYVSSSIPVIIGGQKGLVEEHELKIPNMRGIMNARSKPLKVIEPIDHEKLTNSISFKKPSEKSSCKIINEDNVSELVSLLRNEAKVI